MTRLLWLTDLHLNFVAPDAKQYLKDEIASHRPEAVLVAGDTGESDSWLPFLVELKQSAGCPVHFVLGNHDFYRSSIVAEREKASSIPASSEFPHWLPATGFVQLDDQTALVGHDGWGDATTPEFRTSDVLLNDYLLIEELRAATGIDDRNADQISVESLLTPELQSTLQDLGRESGDHFRHLLPEAAKHCRRLIVLTHVPPFREACWHDGRISDDNWAPHFTCVGVGRALAEFMQTHPDHQMLVLCGHTHGAGIAQVLPNLRVETGGAVYGHPRIQKVWNTAE